MPKSKTKSGGNSSKGSKAGRKSTGNAAKGKSQSANAKAKEPDFPVLLKFFESLPTEIRNTIFHHLSSLIPFKLLPLSRDTYKRVLPTAYHTVSIQKHYSGPVTFFYNLAYPWEEGSSRNYPLFKGRKAETMGHIQRLVFKDQYALEHFYRITAARWPLKGKDKDDVEDSGSTTKGDVSKNAEAEAEVEAEKNDKLHTAPDPAWRYESQCLFPQVKHVTFSDHALSWFWGHDILGRDPSADADEEYEDDGTVRRSLERSIALQGPDFCKYDQVYGDPYAQHLNPETICVEMQSDCNLWSFMDEIGKRGLAHDASRLRQLTIHISDPNLDHVLALDLFSGSNIGKIIDTVFVTFDVLEGAASTRVTVARIANVLRALQRRAIFRSSKRRPCPVFHCFVPALQEIRDRLLPLTSTPIRNPAENSQTGGKVWREGIELAEGLIILSEAESNECTCCGREGRYKYRPLYEPY